MTTESINQAIQKLEDLLPLLGRGRLSWIKFSPDKAVEGYAHGTTGREAPVAPETSFNNDEIKAIVSWANARKVLVRFKGISTLPENAINFNGSLYRVDAWGEVGNVQVRFLALDWRQIEPESLEELGYSTAIPKVEQLLPLIGKNGLVYISISPDRSAVGFTDGDSRDKPLDTKTSFSSKDATFTADEIATIREWVIETGYTVHYTSGGIIPNAIHLDGVLCRVNFWGSTLQFVELDWRQILTSDLDKIGFQYVERREVEKALDELAKRLYGKTVSELSSADIERYRDLVRKPLGL